MLSVAAWLTHQDRSARLTWTVACAFYLAHVWAAFQYVHHWSHTAAYQHTALTAGWGIGLYFNYLFTILWIADVLWWWRGLTSYRNRPAWVSASIHWFFAFMFFNATVVFATGFVRWVGVAATLVLAAIAIRRRRR